MFKKGGIGKSRSETKVSHLKETKKISTQGVDLPGLSPDPKEWGQGTWFAIIADSLLSRTEETIKEFIKRRIPVLVNLLCITCSEHSYIFIQKRHPNKYLVVLDSRGENLGMYNWIVDLKNDVNNRLERPNYPREEVDKLFRPLLELTTEEIMANRESAMSVSTMPHLISLDWSQKPRLASKLSQLNPNPDAWGKGVWALLFMDALRSRTKTAIIEFIKRVIPIVVNLLDEKSSTRAYDLITKRHPLKYVEIYDWREENIGMYVWLIDLKNDINAILGKPHYPKSRVDFMWLPLLELSKDDIESDREAAMTVETMANIVYLEYFPEDESSQEEVKEVKPCATCGSH